MPVLTKINRGSLATGVVGTAELADGTIAAVDLATGAALANLADDSITIAKMGTMMSVGETAPTSPAPFIGQNWFRLSTGTTYQYTNDGTSSFWLDVSSGGIGTSASKSVDFAGDIDPHKSSVTVADGLVVGSVYYNKVKNKHFICTTATDDANVWSGRYDGWGGIITDYLLSGTKYRVHTFLTSGTFVSDKALSVDYLVVAGGGGGAGGVYSGGGGAGGLLTAAALSVPVGSYSVTVGNGGIGGPSNLTTGQLDFSPIVGGDSTFHTITATGGGRGAYFHQDTIGLPGGSGGGAGYNGTVYAGGTSTASPNQGNDGGAGGGSHGYSGGGGGGAGGAGISGATSGATGSGGGAGLANYYRDGNTSGTTAGIHVFAGGGGGAWQVAGGGIGGKVGTTVLGGDGGGGSTESDAGEAGVANTGSGGGGGGVVGTQYQPGGNGGTGIVVIRYAIT